MASGRRSTEVGRFIRQQVIPAGMSVTEAARRLGVGRPALSNLLNGKASLSQDMAFRLEGTFGAERTKLLALQAESDQARRRVEDRSMAVGTYAPSFLLTIEARQIDAWAGRIRARDHLPVLLRRLVHATGRELRRVNFPGYDNSQRRGWDGRVEADAAAVWVPEGRSFWEFGVDQRPKAKADRDYQARRGALPPEERAKCTFVFVTPRNWPGRDEWVRGKEAAGEWKAVRAYDASDLEQWLETTIAPRIWFAGELGIPTEGFRSLERFWQEWAEASEPPMTAAIFAPSVAAHVERFREWLKKERPERPFTVAADSREEAVAFLACLLRHRDLPDRDRDRAVVFESAGLLKSLAQSPSPIIPIVYADETERALPTVYRERHAIVVRPRNAVDREPDAAVELLAYTAFEQALADMGVEQGRVDWLARASGRSPTILRRRLSQIPAIKAPPWAEDEAVARQLIPMALVGAWHAGSRTDCAVLKALAGRAYERVEEDVAELLRHDDCPIWRVGHYRGVVSRIDALFAVGPRVTEIDIVCFLNVARCVLCESDPAELLVDPNRPAPRAPFYWHAPGAKFFGRARGYSDALRVGVCETLVGLSVHGATLFRDDMGMDVAERVAALVEDLLSQFTDDVLRQHADILPRLAEAAPHQFLTLLEADLDRTEPVLQRFLRPATPGSFVQPVRAAVLWALERLAWDSRTLPRVVRILARLSQTRIDDNWINKPIASLSAIFRSWLPQTAAPLDRRIEALETLCRDFRDVGWQVCIQQFAGGREVAFPNDRPRWRGDDAGAGRPLRGEEPHEFARKALDLAISWRKHNERTLAALVQRLGVMSAKDQLSVWSAIDAWSRTETRETAKAKLREQIRRRVLTRNGRSGPGAEHRDRAREACEKLAPADLVIRHAWLFADAWVKESADELFDEHLDFRSRVDKVHELRVEAMKKIWTARGSEGAFTLLANCDAWTVGHYAASCAIEPDAAAGVLRACLTRSIETAERLDGFMTGFLVGVGENTRADLLSTFAETATEAQVVRLFTCAPFSGRTWRLLDRQDSRVRGGYWRTVYASGQPFAETEATELIDRFLEVGRPKEAFRAVQFDWAKVETSRLKRLLNALEGESADLVEVDLYRLSEALASLAGRPGVTAEDMAQLEFTFVEALDPLDYAKHGIPNIERKVADSPFFFVQLLALLYQRRDRGQDPAELRVDSSRRHDSLGTAAFHVLRLIARLPGADVEGRVDANALTRWVNEVRRLCGVYGRAGIGDEQLGRFLSKSPADEDKTWPCRPVCETLETIASQDVADGFVMGVCDLRGVHLRRLDEGGKQERELSAKYRAWGQRLAFEYPYVAGILEHIAGHYDRHAARGDSEARVMKRLER